MGAYTDAQQEQRNHLVLANMGLVGMWVARMAPPGFDQDDLRQGGLLGLIRAAEKFDTANGATFSTYASYWIRKSIQAAIHAAVDRIGAGQEALGERRALDREIETSIVRDGLPPTIDELMGSTGFSEQRVLRLLALPSTSSCAFPDVEPADHCVDEAREVRETAVMVQAALAGLDTHQQRIVRGGFGIGGPRRSMEQLATELELSLREVRSLRSQALECLAVQLAI